MTPNLTKHTAQVPAVAGGARMLNITGDLFVCVECTEQFDLQFDDHPKMQCEAGFEIRFPFDKLTFHTQSGNALTVSFYVGIGPVSYNYNYFQRPVRTIIRPTVDDLASGTDLFPGTYSVAQPFRRKFFHIWNDHATQTLQLRYAGTPMAIVPCRTVLPPFETDAEIGVHNTTATLVTYYVCEIFHISP